MNKLQKVAIIGATHGNEITGYYLIRKLNQFPELTKRKTFTPEFLIANPKAFDAKLRYIDHDLNRCFFAEELNDISLASYEQSRAKALNSYLGPKGGPKFDAIIDLHTTTSSMGGTVMVSSKDPFKLRLAKFIQDRVDNVHIFYSDNIDAKKDRPFLNSIVGKGIVFEIGPIENGVLRQDIFELTEAMIFAALDYIDSYNETERLNEVTASVFCPTGTIKYPTNDNGEIVAMISDKFQGTDYLEIKESTILFVGFDGREYKYDGPEGRYPIFVNEAAYFEDSNAFTICEKRDVRVSPDDTISFVDE